MKKTIYSLSLAFVASISLLSCSKGDYSSGDGQTGFNPFAANSNKPTEQLNGNFSAKIDGNTFSADNNKSFAAKNTGNDTWIISGYKGSGTYPQGFALSIEKKEKGTYTIDITNINADGSAVYQAAASSSAVVAQTGKIEITEVSDKRIKGTFDMKAAGINITDGAFDVPVK